MNLKKNFTLLFAFFGTLCCAFSLQAQTTAKLGEQNPGLSAEKAYLQLDAPFYTAGQTIWFKGYVTLGAKHLLTDKSKVLTIELAGAGGNIFKTVKLPLQDGVCNGHINLTDSVYQGTYTIRAYTNWMRNFGTDAYFSRQINIYDPLVNNLVVSTAYSSQPSGKQTANTITLKFTDESGRLFAEKNVSYQVLLKGHDIKKGSGLTDKKGELKISVATTDTLAGKAVIETRLRLPGHTFSQFVGIKGGVRKTAIQFLPEGGNMVNGLPANIAFKAIGSDGLGQKVTGTVSDNNGNEIAQLESNRLGMGVFSFTPQPGSSYKASVKTVDGRVVTANLPFALDNGYVMRVFTDTSHVAVAVYGKTGADAASILHLQAQVQNLVCFAADIKIKGNVPLFVRIPKDKFPSGVIQFTLLSGNGVPLNERVIFNNNPDNRIDLNVNTDKLTYLPRQKVQVDIAATDNDKDAVLGNFSAAVVNETLLGSSAENSILTSLLLTSDLKGYVEDPEYYFSADSHAGADLDLLMLTQGYRKFVTPASAEFIADQGLSIRGHVKTTNGIGVPNAKVRLLTTSGPPVMLDTLSDNNGRFVFTDLNFADSTRFVIQATTLKGKKEVVVGLDSSTVMSIANNFYATDTTTAAPQSFYNTAKVQFEQFETLGAGRGRYLKEVKIQDKRPAYLKNSSNLNGPGKANYVLDGKKLREMACPTVASCLVGKLPGVIFDERGNPRAPRNIESAVRPRPGIMLVVIDGVRQMTNDNDPSMHTGPGPLDNIAPGDIASVEVLLDASYAIVYGPEAKNGVLVITTRRGDEEIEEMVHDANNLNIRPTGYQVVREFYSPDYSVTNDIYKPDPRTTIMWNPQIVTDDKGKAGFSFYNADGKGTYRITVEGIDRNGNLGHRVYRYKVE